MGVLVSPPWTTWHDPSSPIQIWSEVRNPGQNRVVVRISVGVGVGVGFVLDVVGVGVVLDIHGIVGTDANASVMAKASVKGNVIFRVLLGILVGVGVGVGVVLHS